MSSRWMFGIRTIVLALFFCALLFLSLSVPHTFVSPDENANAFFATRWATEGVLFQEESLNLSLHGLLHPRSILANGAWLVPGSFLGLPVLAGSLATLVGPFGMFLFTPVLAVLALLALRSLMFFFSREAFFADAAALFLLLHPAFWYYASRPMMHNVAFLAFLLFAAWFGMVAPSFFHRRTVVFFLSGACLGLALAIRASEALWVIPVCAILFFLYRRVWSWRACAFWILGCLIALMPFAAWNHVLYGSLTETAYTVDVQMPDAPVAPSSTMDISSFSLAHAFFPFGLHLLRAGKRVLLYGVLLYPWTAILPLAGWIGVCMALIRRKTDLVSHKTTIIFLILSFLVSAYLAVLYGSWIIKDNPNPDAVTIGNSYVRYWLPIFAVGSIWAAATVTWVRERFGSRSWFMPLLLVVSVGYAAASGHAVFSGEDGLWATRKNLVAFADKRTFVLEQTEPQAIVIVDRADKFIFPDRRVVVPLRSDTTYAALSQMASIAPLYYFGIPFPPEDIMFLEETRLRPQGLQIELVGPSGDEALYRIYAP